MSREPSRPRRGRASPGRVVVFGEVLCDLFTHRPGVRLRDADAFVPHQGGAPANVAVQLARLGVRTTLLSAVGNDPLGARLKDDLRRDGVDVSCVAVRDGRRTGLTLVEVDDDGERRFYGYREGSADLTLSPADLDTPVARRALRDAVVVHTGTVTLRSPGARRATSQLQRQARGRGAIVSLDVNLRPGMFPSLPALLRLARAAVRRVDIVKATREEALLLTEVRASSAARRAIDDDALVDALLSWGPQLVLLTLDADGAVVATRAARARVPAPSVRAVDATGAGDGFVGAVLAALVRADVGVNDLRRLPAELLEDLGHIGCHAGAAVVTALGATTAMVRATHR